MLRNDTAQESLDEVVALAYHELRRIAHHRLATRDRDGGNGRTLSTTALVNEAYLKLSEQSRANWRDHSHFLAVASLAMRHVIVDRAASNAPRLKRGGARRRITLDDVDLAVDDQPDVVLQIDDALETHRDRRAARRQSR